MQVMNSTMRYKRRLSLTSEIQNLQLNASILKAIIDDGVSENSNFSPFIPQDSFKKHIDVLSELERVLSKSHMENMVSFTYRENTELISAQDVLLRLADHLYKYCDIVNYDIRPYYFACLTQLIKRG